MNQGPSGRFCLSKQDQSFLTNVYGKTNLYSLIGLGTIKHHEVDHSKGQEREDGKKTAREKVSPRSQRHCLRHGTWNILIILEHGWTEIIRDWQSNK